MKYLGAFKSKRFGLVEVWSGHYDGPQGPLAIQLTSDDGEPLATLSVNMHKPHCSQDSRELPPNCFYAKTWSENEGLAREAIDSSFFQLRPDLPTAASGYVTAEAWELLE
jgi:hypothetical protein